MRPSRHGFLLILLLGSGPVVADDRVEPTVGMPARIEQLVLPGPELESKPMEDRLIPVVARITAVYSHGTAFRYDLLYYGLEPGTFDLKDYLRRKDGSSSADLPTIPVTIRAVLPPGQIEPHGPQPHPIPRHGGYRMLLVLGSVAWVVGLVVLLILGRRNRIRITADSDLPVTPADRLGPLVESAIAGTLSEGEHAELERLLIGYWRHRLGLEETDPAEAIATIRRDEHAGPHFRQLEEWLHRPDGPARVDVSAILAPYRDHPDEALNGAPEISGRSS